MIAAFCLVLAAVPGATEDYEAHEFSGRDGKMPYRLLKPQSVEKDKKYPLVLILHGWGERGTDNKSQLKSFGAAFTKPAVREKFPCFVLLPQANESWIQHPKFENPIPLSPKPTNNLRMAMAILDQVKKKEAVDSDRLYLMGYSNGGCGVWELVERNPKLWAAAAPMAGAGDPKRIAVAKHLPIWAFHADKDNAVPLQRMEEMTTALREAHGDPLFSIYSSANHWDAREKGLGEPNLLPWMFAQRRGKPAVPFDEVA